jgi:hypothetical protein
MTSPTRRPICASRTALLVGAALAMLCSCGGGFQSSPPTQLSYFPADMKNPQLEVSGIYEDGWTAKAVSLILRQPPGEEALVIRGMVPKISADGFETGVSVRVNEKEVAQKSVGIGDFQIAIPMEPGAGSRRIELRFSATQQLPAGDGRAVGAHILSIGFVPAGSISAPPRDIVRGPEVQLGSGWGQLETFKNQTFRWIENDAQVFVRPARGGDLALTVKVEPGPGLGGKGLLQLMDASGRQVGAEAIDRETTIRFSMPVEAGKTNEFRLHVNGGGKRIASDPRILNFRVFELGTTPVQH